MPDQIYYQRDIIKVKKRELPGGTLETHPFLILSCELANNSDNTERYYTGVMLTHTKYKDRFTFEVTPDMIEGHHDGSWSQIRLYIISGFTNSSISTDAGCYIGKLKPAFFKEVLETIKDYVLFNDRK